MSSFQDCGEYESFVAYMARVYVSDLRRFYKDVEHDVVPCTSKAYLRFYSTERHLTMLLPELIRELKGRV